MTASWVAAAVNVILVFSLTGALGIYGPIISSIAALAAAMAYTLPPMMRTAGITLAESVRRAWIPAMSVGAGLAAVLLGARWGLHLTSKPATAAVVVIAPLLFWLAYTVLWATPDERALAMARSAPSGPRRSQPR